jgi:5'-phosphate synthase pdxT subunit
MILLSSTNVSNNLQPLDIMDFTVNRNAYGRQIESFSDDFQLDFCDDENFHGVFIRAPKISKMGKSIIILAKYKKQPVMITDGRHFVTTFHPEIGSDVRIHNYFMEQINA